MLIFLENFANALMSDWSYFHVGTGGGCPDFHFRPGAGPFFEFHEP